MAILEQFKRSEEINMNTETEVVETSAVAVREPSGAVGQAMSIRDIIAQVKLIQDVMREVMKENEHYGTIPGCGDKKTLFLPGAQKLTMTFRLAPEYSIQETDLPRGHKEYRITCTLRSISTGNPVGQGVGCCSSMEGKYRWTSGEGEPTGNPVPKDYWSDRDISKIGGKEFFPKKVDGQWFIFKKTEKVENDNPASVFNTVLKMAKKRAFVDATITATAASDIFTQDIGDPESDPELSSKEEYIPKAKTTPKPTPARPEATQTPKPATPEAPKAPSQGAIQADRMFRKKEVGLSDDELALGIDYAERCFAKFRTDWDKAGMSKQLLAYAIAEGWIMEGEKIEKSKLHFAPLTKEEFEDLNAKVRAFAAKSHDPIDGPVPGAEPSPEAPEISPWREFPMPFGKQAGVMLGELDKKTLFGWWCNYKVETEYNGKPKKPETIAKDMEFRDMLDEAGRELEFSKKD